MNESKWNSKFNPKNQASTKDWSVNCIPGSDNGIMTIQPIQDMVENGNTCNWVIENPRVQGVPNLERTSGVMCIWLHDTLGPNNNEETSPMNMAWIEHKEYMDTALGQQFGYSAADLGQVIGAFKTIVDIGRVIRRTLNLLNNPRTPLSQYSIAGLLYAMRLGTEDVYDTDPLLVQRELARNRRNYIDDFNQANTLLDKMGIPEKLTNLMDVTEDYYSKVYLDNTSENAQFYMFMPVGWYHYDETEDPAGATLTYKNFWADLNTPRLTDQNHANYHNHHYSLRDLIDLYTKLIMDITQFSDSRAILQKLYNAYGTDKLYKIPEANLDDKVPYVYDAGFRNTIRNMAWFKDITYAKYTVDPNREIVLGRPKYVNTSGAMDSGVASNFANIPLQFSDAPAKITDKMIADALVLHPVFGYVRRYSDETTSSKYRLEVDFGNQFGFAIPVEVDLISAGYDGQGKMQMFNENKLVSRLDALGDVSAKMLDWQFRPTTVATNLKSVETGFKSVKMQLIKYFQERETEVTVSQASLAYWFRAFAIGVYKTNEVMKTKGQRSIIG